MVWHEAGNRIELYGSEGTLIYEKRIGARNQWELAIPVALEQRSSAGKRSWSGAKPCCQTVFDLPGGLGYAPPAFEGNAAEVASAPVGR